MRGGVDSIHKMNRTKSTTSGTVKRGLAHQRGFTVVELMAVVLIICVLSALALGLAGYIQRRVAASTTRAQIAAIETALENYRSDWGYYPPSFPMRLSSQGLAEQTNNTVLYRSLFLQGKQYLKFPPGQLHSNLMQQFQATQPVNIYDVYGRPFVYYCSPQTPFSFSNEYVGMFRILGTVVRPYTNYYTLGGQVNIKSYDLFSYGPDLITFAATNADFVSLLPPYTYQTTEYYAWRDPKSALDDVTNWSTNP